MPGSPFSPGLIESTILVDALRKFAPGVTFVNDAVAAGWAATSVTCQMELIVGCRNLTELAEIKKAVGKANPRIAIASRNANRSE